MIDSERVMHGRLQLDRCGGGSMLMSAGGRLMVGWRVARLLLDEAAVG
jgi:hypothetical protein